MVNWKNKEEVKEYMKEWGKTYYQKPKVKQRYKEYKKKYYQNN